MIQRPPISTQTLGKLDLAFQRLLDGRAPQEGLYSSDGNAHLDAMAAQHTAVARAKGHPFCSCHWCCTHRLTIMLEGQLQRIRARLHEDLSTLT